MSRRTENAKSQIPVIAPSARQLELGERMAIAHIMEEFRKKLAHRGTDARVTLRSRKVLAKALFSGRRTLEKSEGTLGAEAMRTIARMSANHKKRGKALARQVANRPLIQSFPSGRRPITPAFSTGSAVRTPPYDSARGIRPPQIPAGAVGNASASKAGGMNWELSSSESTAVNISASTLMGITVTPMFGPWLCPFFSWVNLASSLSQEVTGVATSGFFNESTSEGHLGWLVEEFDANWNFRQILVRASSETFYLQSDWGNQQSFATFGPLSIQGQFIANPLSNYLVFVWSWGVITANAASAGAFGSAAAGSDNKFVESIAWDAYLTWL